MTLGIASGLNTLERMTMSEQRSEYEYDQAKKIVKILSSNGVIPSCTVPIDQYMNTWDAAFEILDLLTP